MYPWRRILIPTDFSTASEWVFDDAVRIAGSTGAEIVILHIRNERHFPADPKVYEYAEQFELDKLRDRIRRANATIPTRLVVKNASDPGAEICRTVTAESVDLVVMATHARHHVAHLLIGSTTRNVITDPPVPVLAIRYGVKKRGGMRKIVVPVHTKQKSHSALELAATIASREHGEVHLLTICKNDETSRAQALHAEVSTAIPRAPLKQAVVIGDDIEKELVRYSERNEVDAVFLNATETPSPLKIDLIRGVPAPVMIVPVG